MKPTENKNDTTRLAVLGVGLIVIVALLIMQVQNFNAPQDTPIPAVGTTDKVASAAPAEPGGFESIIPPSGPGVANADPFRPVLIKSGPRVVPPVVEKLPPSEITGTKPGTRPADPNQTPGVAIQRPPSPRLTGVLLGNQPLAVLELDGKSQMASLGQTLPGGFRLIAITEKSVQLAFGKEVITLTLGE